MGSGVRARDLTGIWGANSARADSEKLLFVNPISPLRALEKRNTELRVHVSNLSQFKAHRITEDLGKAQSKIVSFIPNKKKNCTNLGGSC